MSSILDNRIPVTINVDATTGDISWDKRLVDHNVDTFYRGKTVTNNEFNDLFLRHSYQSDYLADTLEQLFNGGKLRSAVSGTFRSEFELKPSYVKVFSTEDWGELQSDGYYYITIPASEHGFTQIEHSENPADNMNLDTEMYLLAADGKFYEVMQVTVAQDNTVTIYTDDNTLIGFLVIRLNDRSYVLQDAIIDAAQVRGLADVAYNGKYTSLTDHNVIEDRVTANENTLESILSDTAGVNPFVHNADYATDADTAVHLAGENATINNIPVSNIFEEGSRVVKEATNAVNATLLNNVRLTKGSNNTIMLTTPVGSRSIMTATELFSGTVSWETPITIPEVFKGRYNLYCIVLENITGSNILIPNNADAFVGYFIADNDYPNGYSGGYFRPYVRTHINMYGGTSTLQNYTQYFFDFTVKISENKFELNGGAITMTYMHCQSDTVTPTTVYCKSVRHNQSVLGTTCTITGCKCTLYGFGAAALT